MTQLHAVSFQPVICLLHILRLIALHQNVKGKNLDQIKTGPAAARIESFPPFCTLSEWLKVDLQDVATAEEELARRKVEALNGRKQADRLRKECAKTQKDKEKADADLEALSTSVSVRSPLLVSGPREDIMANDLLSHHASCL